MRDGSVEFWQNWDVLVGEACDRALVELREKDEEYAAARKTIDAAEERLRTVLENAGANEILEEFQKYLDTVASLEFTHELEACYRVGARDGLRLANEVGLLKL